MNSIIVKQLSVSFKNQSVLSGINLEIEQGTCMGFIGHNGSGKTVLLKTICGFLPYNEGTIFVNDNKIVAGKEFIHNAGILIEQPNMIPYLTGKENLLLLASIERKISQEKILDCLDLVGLTNAINKKVKSYSLGMKQRLRIAQAIMENPNILILDEPFNGLDKNGVSEMLSLFSKFKKMGKTILLTSHDDRQINFLCDKVYELEGGCLHEI